MSRIVQLVRIFYRKLFRTDRLTRLKAHGLVVGKDFDMLDSVIIDSSHCWLITIGDHVTLASRVHILAHDASMKKFLGYTKIGKVSIGNHVFVGASTVILPGVTIGNNVVIGAGSVVTHDIPDGVVAVGNPARILGTIDEFISRKRKELDRFPRFGIEYTIDKNITDEMKREMLVKMADRYGYVI